MNTTISSSGKTTVIARGRSVMEAFRSRTLTLNPVQILQVGTWLEKTYAEFVKPKLSNDRDQKYRRLLLQVKKRMLEEQDYDGLVLCVAMLNTDNSIGETRLLMVETDEEGQVVSVREDAMLSFDKLAIH